MMRCYHRRYVDSETVEKISVIESETQSIEKSVTNININWHYLSLLSYKLEFRTTETTNNSIHTPLKKCTNVWHIFEYKNIYMCNVDVHLRYMSIYILYKLGDTKESKPPLLSFSL